MKEITSTEIEIEYKEHLIPLAIDGYVEYSVDRSYGEDADGNRGEKLVTVDEVEIVDAYDEDGNGYELNEQQLEQAKEALARKFLEG